MALLALVVVRVSSAAMPVSTLSRIALLSPSDPAFVFERARREYSQTGRISRDRLDAVLAAARRAPLAEQPFLFAALSPAPAGAAPTIRLLEEARRRNPRLQLARLGLIEHYVRAGRIAAAAAEIKVASRLVSDIGNVLVDPLTRLALDPGTRPALQRAMGDDPLLDNVLTQLVQQGAPARLVLELAAPRMRAYGSGPPPAWQVLLVERLVERRAYAAAFATWRRFNRIDAAPGALYNPNFQPMRGGPPFNWALSSDASGAIEPGSDGSIEIVYFGRQDSALARQLLLLPAGRYRLELAAASSDDSGGSRLTWQLSCAGSNVRLAQIALDRLASAPRRLRADFSVPATGCAAQWLRLNGEAAEFPIRRQVRMSGLRLRRAA
ncbi:MAG: hypothetical protein ACT4OE_02700 [Sphingosinicella sp.]